LLQTIHYSDILKDQITIIFLLPK